LFNFYIGAEDSEKYLAGIIVSAVLLVISLVFLAYFIYQIRLLKSSKANPENKSRDSNNSKDIYENPDKIKVDANYEQVENEQSTYKGLEKTGEEENDDHLYSHLNEGLRESEGNWNLRGLALVRSPFGLCSE
jgi:biopolymer transport protein ExbB/TolQ